MTTTVKSTIATSLNAAEPGLLPDVLRQLALGTLLAPVVEEIDINAAEAVTITLTKAAFLVLACIVTTTSGAGEEDVGPKVVGRGVTASEAKAIALLSADGTTITFEKKVQKVTVSYLPATALLADYYP